MSVLRVNRISNEAGTGNVELTYGATVPSNGSVVVDQMNVTAGVSTFNNVLATNVSISGVCTANAFVGDGQFITGLTGTTNGVAISYTLVL